MRKIIPPDAVLIPGYAAKAFQGALFSVYQWAQNMSDGSIKRYEMLKRPDSAFVIAVKDNKIVVLKESQPGRGNIMALPGGRVEQAEDPAQAAARELAAKTGLVFDKYQMVLVTQPNDKIEWFVYIYVATNFRNAVAPQLEAWEQIQMAFMDYEEFSRLARTNYRLAGDFVSRYGNLESMLAAPKYQGTALDE